MLTQAMLELWESLHSIKGDLKQLKSTVGMVVEQARAQMVHGCTELWRVIGAKSSIWIRLRIYIYYCKPYYSRTGCLPRFANSASCPVQILLDGYPGGYRVFREINVIPAGNSTSILNSVSRKVRLSNCIRDLRISHYHSTQMKLVEHSSTAQPRSMSWVVVALIECLPWV